MSDFEKRFAIYKKHFTDNRVPECCKCFRRSELYDNEGGEYFCEACLEEDLMKNIEDFTALTDRYLKNPKERGE